MCGFLMVLDRTLAWEMLYACIIISIINFNNLALKGTHKTKAVATFVLRNVPSCGVPFLVKTPYMSCGNATCGKKYFH